MKYYVGTITTREGEREHDTKFRFKTRGNPENYLDRIAKRFWGQPDKQTGPHDPWHFSGGEISCWGDDYKEIAKDTYLDLTGALVELCPKDKGD